MTAKMEEFPYRHYPNELGRYSFRVRLHLTLDMIFFYVAIHQEAPQSNLLEIRYDKPKQGITKQNETNNSNS